MYTLIIYVLYYEDYKKEKRVNTCDSQNGDPKVNTVLTQLFLLVAFFVLAILEKLRISCKLHDSLSKKNEEKPIQNETSHPYPVVQWCNMHQSQKGLLVVLVRQVHTGTRCMNRYGLLLLETSCPLVIMFSVMLGGTLLKPSYCTTCTRTCNEHAVYKKGCHNFGSP